MMSISKACDVLIRAINKSFIDEKAAEIKADLFEAVEGRAIYLDCAECERTLTGTEATDQVHLRRFLQALENLGCRSRI